MFRNFLFLMPFLLIACNNTAQNKIDISKENKTTMQKQNIYQFKVTDLYGNTFDFSTLKGKLKIEKTDNLKDNTFGRAVSLTK